MKCLIFSLYIIGIFSKTQSDVCFPPEWCQGHKNVELKINEIYFFDTALTADTCPPCSYTFNLNNPNKINIIGYAATKKYDTSHFDISHSAYPSPTIYYFNETAKPFQVTSEYTTGFVIYENEARKYPLEFISTDKPFNFTDVNQVLYLENGMAGNNMTGAPCKWQFTAPNGYGFKVIVYIFQSDANTRLIIKNQTDLLVNERSLKLYHPIYNSDNYIQIYLSNHQQNLHFQASVSIVKQHVVIEDGRCFSYNNTNFIEWGTMENLPAPTRRSNNVKCLYKLSILPNTQVVVDSDKWDLGDYADYVGYYDNENGGDLVKYFTGENEPLPSLFFLGYDNGSTRYITWEYFSDGSIPGYGFHIQFSGQDCGSKNQKIFCGVPQTNLCPNVEYVYTLLPCLTKYFQLGFLGSPITSLYSPDNFEVFSNGTMVYQLQDASHGSIINAVILPSNAENIAKFYTSTIFSLGFYTLPYFLSKANAYVKLSFENPMYIMDSRVNPKVVFEISDELEAFNFSTEITRHKGGEISFFTDETLTLQISSKCTYLNQIISNFDTCSIKNHKTFVVYSVGYVNIYPYTAIQISKNQKCLFGRTIFHIEDGLHANERILSFISRPNIPCSIILLSTPAPDAVIEITKVWTTSVNENVKIYGGDFQNITIAEFNSKSQNTWKNFRLNSFVYTIEIPKNSSIFIIVSAKPEM